MLILLVNRGDNNNNHWFWVPLVGTFRKIPITHYKPMPTGGADDILQIEHTGIYKITISPTHIGTALEDTIQSIFDLQGRSTLNLDQFTLQNIYNTFNALVSLFTACSAGRITSVNDEAIDLQYDITGWADSADEKNVLTFAKLNIYNLSGSNTRIGLLSIPNDTRQVRMINIAKTTQNNIDTYSYTELIDVTINNSIRINSNTYYPNTLNLHLYIGETISINITQQSTYMVDTKTKNITPHMYPPTAHGYGTTLMPMEKNTVIDSMSVFINRYRNLSNYEENMLFYDTLSQ